MRSYQIYTPTSSRQPVRSYQEMSPEERAGIVARLYRRMGQVVTDEPTPAPEALIEVAPAPALEPEDVPIDHDVEATSLAYAEAFLQARGRPASVDLIADYIELMEQAAFYDGMAELVRDEPVEVTIDHTFSPTDIHRYLFRLIPRRYGPRKWVVGQAIRDLEAKAEEYRQQAQALVHAP